MNFANSTGAAVPVILDGSGRVPVTIPGTVATTDSQGGTREHATVGISRTAVVTASTRIALPTLGASRELYVMANNRCFFLTGNSAVVAAAGTSHPLGADERFYIRVPAGHTHIAFIRDTADGFISVVPVA